MKELARRFQNWFKNRNLRPIPILLYHRVANLDSDPQLLCVTKENFEVQLEILKEKYQVLHLDQLRTQYEKGINHNTNLAITFDDGYADNLLNAKPILDKYCLPATIFIATDYVRNPREYWWDELEKIFLSSGKLPQHLVLEINSKKLSWNLEDDEYYSEEDVKKDCLWNVTQNTFPTIRHRIYTSLCDELRPLRENERQKILHALRQWADIAEEIRESHRPLTMNELASVRNDKLIRFGAHTMNHSVLSQLSKDEQSFEINESKKYLESLLGRPVQSFAYPFGTESDYDQETVRLVKGAGFKIACSNFEPAYGRSIDFFQMPRFIVRNWTAGEFKQQLLDRLPE
jgi:peptidoglycan/xylan/chitin deacetylase (PgdA/CDA1 family)